MTAQGGTGRLLSPADLALWAGAWLVVAVLLVATGFASDDPDSALYAALSARLAEGPPLQWVAPEWWGRWNSEGLFVEHPVGVLLVPTVLGAMGVPAAQAAYIVGIASGLAALVLIGVLVTRITTVSDGRLVLVLLQLMPMAFVFRIRANHEYPMLLCLLIVLIGLDGVRRSWTWVIAVAAGLAWALLIKGVFVAIVLIGAGLWIVTNPTRASGSAARPLLSCLAALVVTAGVAIGYDVWYQHATGTTFWLPYWRRQLGPLTIATPLEGGSTIGAHLWFYLLRLLWHPAPWSLAILAAGWRWRGGLRARWHTLSPGARRGLVFALAFAAASTLLLSPASRFAERYVFSANYAIGALGAVVACYQWPALREHVERLWTRVPALPVWTWLALMLLRLALGPWLPRVSVT